MAIIIVPDAERRPIGWFDPEIGGGFDREIMDDGVSSFDPAFMAAMDRPWRDIVFSKPSVVASGMTPPASSPT